MSEVSEQSLEKEWKDFTPLEKATYFAEKGDPFTLEFMIAIGRLESVEEKTLRTLLSRAYKEAVIRIERQAAEGKYVLEAWNMSGLAEAYSSTPRNFRSRSLEVLFNPEGRNLLDQIRGWNPSVFPKLDTPFA